MRFKFPHLLLLALVLATGLSGCSKIPENNDPVIGIWSRTAAPEDTSRTKPQREEWIFNDVYLGRYHRYDGLNITVQSDFSWSIDKGIYTIEYPGLDREPEQVTMEKSPEGIILETLAGEVLAERE